MTEEAFPKDELTEKEEMYAQMRAAGHSKSKAAMKAYDTKNPRQMGYYTEQKECVRERIRELKEERAESAGLDVHEQVRRYNELDLMALEKGQLGLAKDMLVRIDAIGGFDAPSKSVSMSIKGNSDDILKTEDIQKDIDRFSKVLGKHTEVTSKDDTKH
jgi:hypothetical protein